MSRTRTWSAVGPFFFLFRATDKSCPQGMRTSSQILIFIDVQKALNAGIKFSLSDNGVVLTEGDEKGFLSKQFFEKVVDVKKGELVGWQDA